MIKLTNNAINRINLQLEKRGSGVGIRIGVKPTGCSGFSYILEFVDVPELDDNEYKFENFSVFVDHKSLLYVSGLEIDYKKVELNEGFEFMNPTEKSRCGCGESFTI
jgi:iron-sulfur cluster assembly protein